MGDVMDWSSLQYLNDTDFGVGVGDLTRIQEVSLARNGNW